MRGVARNRGGRRREEGQRVRQALTQKLASTMTHRTRHCMTNTLSPLLQQARAAVAVLMPFLAVRVGGGTPGTPHCLSSQRWWR